MSDPLSGVPQESILGQFLFIILMNDMALETEDTERDIYADDSTLTATGEYTETLVDKLNSDVENIVVWFYDNRMAVNTDKMEKKTCLSPHTSAFIKLPVKQLQIYINDQ